MSAPPSSLDPLYCLTIRRWAPCTVVLDVRQKEHPPRWATRVEVSVQRVARGEPVESSIPSVYIDSQSALRISRGLTDYFTTIDMADKAQHIFFPPLGHHLKYRLPSDDYLAMLPSGTSSSLLFLAAQQLMMIFALGYTRRDSILRLGLFLPVVMSCLLGLSIYRQHPVTSSAILMIVVPLGAASQLLQYISLVLIRRWSFEDKEKLFPSSAPSQMPTWLNRLKFGLYAAHSFRHCGTTYEVGGVAQFKDNKVPTRAQFLLRTGAIVAVNFVVMDFVAYFSGTEENPAFAQSRVPLLSRLDEVTIAELFERMTIVTLLYASNIALLTIGIGVVSIISVATGLSEPFRWKPSFNYDHGFPYSVRRFWR